MPKSLFSKQYNTRNFFLFLLIRRDKFWQTVCLSLLASGLWLQNAKEIKAANPPSAYLQLLSPQGTVSPYHPEPLLKSAPLITTVTDKSPQELLKTAEAIYNKILQNVSLPNENH